MISGIADICNELRYSQTLENWSTIKIVGGLTVVVPAIIGFISYLLQSRLLDKWRANGQKELEVLKGTIERNNSVLTSVLSKSQLDFILVKNPDALEKICDSAIGTKRNRLFIRSIEKT